MQTYTLRNEQITVGFTTFGGTMTSIRDRSGLEYLWQGDKKYWSGQAPVLFPICGSLRNDRAEIGSGKETQMPRHGLIRKKEFTLKNKTEDSIEFSIENDEEMLKKYPYSFRVGTRYTLKEKSIEVTYTVENLSDQPMPFQIGGHPGFNCPLKPEEEYSDYSIRFVQKENCTVPTQLPESGLVDTKRRHEFLKDTDTLHLTHDLFHVDAVTLDELKSRSVRLISEKSGCGVQVDFVDFPYLILWSSANDGPFVAIEPWHGLSTCTDEGDVFEEKRGVVISEPGEKREFHFTITVL